jgi:hypothetical protein
MVITWEAVRATLPELGGELRDERSVLGLINEVHALVIKVAKRHRIGEVRVEFPTPRSRPIGAVPISVLLFECAIHSV